MRTSSSTRRPDPPVMDPLLGAYLSATLLLVATPGATTAVVIRNTLDGGRRAGLGAAAGAALANTTHALTAGLGLGLALQRVPQVAEWVRLAGGAYFVWLGSRGLWRAATRPPVGPLVPLQPGGQVHLSLREGLMVNLLNPSIPSFYLAVVPSFVPAGRPLSWFALLAACHVSMALAAHSLWAVALDAVRAVFARPVARRALEVATGLALISLGGRVLLR